MENVNGKFIAERVAVLENESQNHEKRIEKLEDNNELLYRLTVVSEQQSEMIKNQQGQMDKISGTFTEINNNLTKLNMSQDELQDDVRKIGNRVDSIEDDIKKEADKGSISTNDIVKKYVNWWLLLPTSIIGSAILALVMKWLGL